MKEVTEDQILQAKELMIQLGKMNKGVNAHTINKASFYLNDKRAIPLLITPVSKAINTGDWHEVSFLMHKWF